MIQDLRLEINLTILELRLFPVLKCADAKITVIFLLISLLEYSSLDIKSHYIIRISNSIEEQIFSISGRQFSRKYHNS